MSTALSFRERAGSTSKMGFIDAPFGAEQCGRTSDSPSVVASPLVRFGVAAPSEVFTIEIGMGMLPIGLFVKLSAGN